MHYLLVYVVPMEFKILVQSARTIALTRIGHADEREAQGPVLYVLVELVTGER